MRHWFRSTARPAPLTPMTYLYVSDAKVDMLADGLDASWLDRFDLKVKAGMPGLGAEIGRRDIATGRFARAQRLCAALDAQGRIGSLQDSHSEFFRGEMFAAWGFWNRQDHGYADVVFFSGYPHDDTFVGLGGSAYHTMERNAARQQQFSNSGLQMLMAFLRERSEAADRGAFRKEPPAAWYAEVLDADHDNPLVPERIEFVAQRLLEQTEHGFRWIIGSPIYVARTGAPTNRRALREYEASRDQYSLRFFGRKRLKEERGRWQIGKPSWPKPISETVDTTPDEIDRA